MQHLLMSSPEPIRLIGELIVSKDMYLSSIHRPSINIFKWPPLKQRRRFFPFFTYSIYIRWEMCLYVCLFFFEGGAGGGGNNCFLFHLDENLGCYGNLKLPLTHNGRHGNCHLLQIFWQTFYKNVSWVVLFVTYECGQTAKFDLLPWT